MAHPTASKSRFRRKGCKEAHGRVRVNGCEAPLGMEGKGDRMKLQDHWVGIGSGVQWRADRIERQSENHGYD